ncbi:bifunctional folylpolyglutamate synthase/dihydrofolate synthase [Malaciobacter canalis]|uniref:Dihydrofolate synthase/folylpolyglutamate synthase n=1 Tax=Malaciobacter canalis TaxID=1912871 RepID=A0ABX4LRL5_9BACT|nr:Mur ligase family protein [Malaciobacter canalis]PHO10605.1 bifunctional folylpolyglutamate synthase/dihydrofolate synthase [Malaciobacter canalis]QEE32053.1 bifunctional folypolyglutamate synthetase / dihydrofolate synthetase [Malaciobacter canalis]
MQENLKDIDLEGFLKYKTLYYDKIDFSTVKNSWECLKTYIDLPYVIHIVGTNGKGSTGRFLAHYLHKKNFNVVHYSSPHIINFNERIWLNGNDVNNEVLENAHKKIQNILDLQLLEKLTYFEYTTLLALYISSKSDYIILEAGLGGEFDATNVVENSLSLITTIDLDHQSFLGNSVEEIARTKMRACDKQMIVGYQIHESVKKSALKVKEEINNEFNKQINIAFVEDFDEYSFSIDFPRYLINNLHLVISCLEFLNIDIDLKLFDDVNLKGRCEKIASNITIDVGHNPLAARALKEHFKDKKITLIYNSYKDKDYKEVLRVLKPIIDEVIIIEIDDKRIVDKLNLLEICKSYNIMASFNLELKKDKEYLVFGSFLVVEKFLGFLGVDEK